MNNRFYQTFFLAFGFVLLLAALPVQAQEPTGGGEIVRDIVGGAALIFRKPVNPAVHDAATPEPGRAGGGKIAGRRGSKTPAKAPAREQEKMLARGNAARSAPKPRYAEAEQQYQLAAQLAPTDARAFAGLGNVYVDQGRFAEAVDAYKQALKVNPDYQAAYMPLAFSLERLKRYPESIEVYQQTVKQDPANPEVYNNLGFTFNQAERYAEAVGVCKQAIKLLGETGEAYRQGLQDRKEVLSHAYKNLGNAYNGLKRYEEAAEALRQSTVIEPTNAAAHFNLGLTLFNAGRYSEAIEAYKQVIKLRPALAPAHFNLGLAYYAIHDETSAMAEYNTLKGIDARLASELYDTIKKQ